MSLCCFNSYKKYIYLLKTCPSPYREPNDVIGTYETALLGHTEHAAVRVGIYPVSVRHEEALGHPRASGRIVVNQVGVSSHYSAGRSANELNAPFSFKSSASKSERESALADRRTLGHFFFAVAGSKKGDL